MRGVRVAPLLGFHPSAAAANQVAADESRTPTGGKRLPFFCSWRPYLNIEQGAVAHRRSWGRVPLAVGKPPIVSGVKLLEVFHVSEENCHHQKSSFVGSAIIEELVYGCQYLRGGKTAGFG